MPRTDMFGKNWQTGDDLAMNSTIRAIGGLENLASYWAQYGDRIKEEEEKQREEEAKQEAQELEQQEKIQNEYHQIKAINEDLPDEVALFIAKLDKGPYRQQLISNLKQEKSTLQKLDPFRDTTALEKLLADYNKQGTLQPVNEMRDFIQNAAEESGLPPEQIINGAVENEYITPNMGTILNQSFGVEGEQPQQEQQVQQQQRDLPFIGDISAENLRQTGAQAATSFLTAPFDSLIELANMASRFKQSFIKTPDFTEAMKLAGLSDEQIKETQHLADQEFSDKPLELPTIKSVISKGLPDGYLTPQSEIQETLNDFAGDVSTFLLPQVAGLKGAALGGKLLRTAKGAGIGNLLKLGAKKIGFGPLTQEVLRLGPLLWHGTGLDDKVSKTIGGWFNTSEKVGEKTPMAASTIHELAQNELSQAKKGGPGTPSYKAVRNTLRDMYDNFLGEGQYDKIAKEVSRDVAPQSQKNFLKFLQGTGGMSPSERAEAVRIFSEKGNTFEAQLFSALEEANPDAAKMQNFVNKIGERVEDVGGYKTSAGKAIGRVGKTFRNALQDPSITSKPYTAIYNPAVKSYSQLQDAERAINWANNKLPKSSFFTLKGALLRGGGGLGTEVLYKPGATILMALKNMATNSHLRDLYQKFAVAAVQQNYPTLIRSAEALNDQLNKMVERNKDKEERMLMRSRNLNQLMK